MSKTAYQFTNNWFAAPRIIWERVLPTFAPKRILEIGCYEGASSCFLIDTFGAQDGFEMHCVDTWGGGIEHEDSGEYATNMARVREHFVNNLDIALSRYSSRPTIVIHEQRSDMVLSHLFATGKRNYFDFIYVDGSHEAPDVICDAVLGFKLLRIGGCMAFDDYLWAEQLPQGKVPLRCPKPAIDSFTNLFFRKIEILNQDLTQVFIKKLSD